MKTLVLALTLMVAFAANGFARAIQILDMKELMAGAELVFVGEVKSVEWSGITTELTYPTWDVDFEWLKVEVEVIEPIKGMKKGDVVRTLMLSTRGRPPIVNGPGMVDPKKGQFFLLCLRPTKIEGVYASITAPFDDDQGIFILKRVRLSIGNFGDDQIMVHDQRDIEIGNLINDNDQVMPKRIEEFRKRYQAEITTKPPKDAIIHIKWTKETSPDGWQWNVPVKDD